ncbi:ABC transporter permease [Rhodoferax fermentans]|uniref:ABC transporter permease n=1 Tax=Rhodoferax fermentans TaxID=28066 RepID=A0A1T1AVP7_RHOFE|nr:iron ABC transporter permease [Rhodoferax fermentans]MBK1685393.1 iron ABC transporter permease [Rhodoferax fermentans]OOV08186.1 ABC transporter permease [Rhodoferax fermentans]
MTPSWLVRLARPRGVWLALLPAAALLLLLLAPVARLAWEGFAGPLSSTDGLSLWQPWQDDYLRWRVIWSLAQAVITCVLALGLGLPLAWVLARFEFAGRALVLRLLMLPFVVPSLVAALGVLALWGPRGVLSGALGIHLQDGPWLLLYGNLFFNLCLVVRAGVDALAKVNARQVAAARSLGATPWRAFWRVEWPAIAPWLLSSLCLVFLYCFAGFGLALVLGGQRYATVEVEIYTLVAYELQLGQASVLALWTLGLTGGVALAYAALEKRLAAPLRLLPIPRVRPQGAPQWLALVLALALLFGICALPILAIFIKAISALWTGATGLFDAETLAALWNTLRFSALALLMATLLGVLHALAAQASVAWRAAAFLPFVVSPVTVAFGLLLLYPSWTASLPLLLAAYAVLAYPFVAKSLSAGLDSLPVHLGQAARTLGASPWRCFWRVTLPLLRPSLRRGMAFAAATALGEFAVTLFLSRPEWATLTTLIYQRLGRPGQANLDAAMVQACVLMTLALLVFLLIEWPVSERGAPRLPRRVSGQTSHPSITQHA